MYDEYIIIGRHVIKLLIIVLCGGEVIYTHYFSSSDNEIDVALNEDLIGRIHTGK